MKTPLSNSVICRSVYEVINNASARITICIHLYVIAFVTRKALMFRFFSLHLVRLSNNVSKREPKILGMQGRSQDFSVGTHSFHLTSSPPPPPKKKKKDQSHFRFTCFLFQIACARVLIEYILTYFSVFFFFELACASGIV